MTSMVRILTLVLGVLFAGLVHAQDQAALIADRITILSENVLRAEGNVEVLFQGYRLKATAITYLSDSKTIEIEGPMSLSDPDGQILILADGGQLSQDFQNGLMTSARVVLDRHLQIAGAELRRVDGRYTQLVKAVASSCHVCKDSDVPLWQILASRVLHDQIKHQVYYQDAIFEVAGIPVFYVPRLRIPDATVERASGFMLPEFKTSSFLGTGFQVPYFQTIGDSADVLLTPYLSAKTTTVGARYRQLFKHGAITFDGAISEDQLVPGKLRGYAFGSGVFFLPRDYELRFDVKASSDESYLFDYGISDQDRLRSDLALSQVRRRAFFNAQASVFTSFRDDEESGAIPSQITQLAYRRAFTPPLTGGRVSYRLTTYWLERISSVDIIGRDYARISGGMDWRRDHVLGPGIKLATMAKLDFDSYIISQDSTADSGSRATATGAVELSWPLIRRAQSGTDLLEPKVQFVISDATAPAVPNEESTMVEFDEGALFSLDRFPGSTEYERGRWINAGVTWSHYDTDGWEGDLTLGRVIRQTDTGQFNTATGLSGATSDWLIAGQLDLGTGFKASTRALLDDDLSISRTDLRTTWVTDDFRIDNNFLWQIAEPEIGRDLDTLELHSDVTFPLALQWDGSLDLRYDLVVLRAASAGLRLTYKSQCITADFGLDRTFTSSDSVRPKTDFTLTLSVPPVAVASKRPAYRCSG